MQDVLSDNCIDNGIFNIVLPTLPVLPEAIASWIPAVSEVIFDIESKSLLGFIEIPVKNPMKFEAASETFAETCLQGE